MDGSLAEAHASLGIVELVFEGDFAAAENRFRRAIELNPNYAAAHLGLADSLIIRGQAAQARDPLRRAQQLGPLSVQIAFGASLHPYFRGEYDQTAVALERALELDSSYAPAYFVLGQVYYRSGAIADARSVWESGGAWLGTGPAWERVLQRIGEPERALVAVNAWLLTNPRPVNWLVPATLYALFGEHERALDWLESDFRQPVASRAVRHADDKAGIRAVP